MARLALVLVKQLSLNWKLCLWDLEEYFTLMYWNLFASMNLLFTSCWSLCPGLFLFHKAYFQSSARPLVLIELFQLLACLNFIEFGLKSINVLYFLPFQERLFDQFGYWVHFFILQLLCYFKLVFHCYIDFHLSHLEIIIIILWSLYLFLRFDWLYFMNLKYINLSHYLLLLYLLISIFLVLY